MPVSMQDSYFDSSSLNTLKLQSKKDGKAALKKVAAEFETIFLKMMLKSMRDATPGDPIFDSDSAKFYRDMHDDQLTLDLSRKGGIGLANMMVKQLERYVPSETQNENAVTQPEANQLKVSKTSQSYSTITSPEKFVEKMWPMAKDASEKLGVSPKVIIAQAALETGWGKYTIKKPDGKDSFNLFNIKADSRWQGDSTKIASYEYGPGGSHKKVSSFRVYGSYKDSFEDYVKFLNSGSRYQDALENKKGDAKFVEALQDSGFATDPNYAKKVKRIMNNELLNNALEKVAKNDIH